MEIKRYAIDLCKFNTCIEPIPDIRRVYACAISGTWNYQKELNNKIFEVKKHNNDVVGVQAQHYSLVMTHLTNLLYLQYVQKKLNPEDNECYIKCNELECIRKLFLCAGMDITCIYKCFEVCRYKHTCETCNN
jgi:hypothetical protein